MATSHGATVRPARPVSRVSTALSWTLAFLAAILPSACRESTGIENRATTVSAVAGDAQFVLANGTLAEPLQVVVLDASTRAPREDVTVSWVVTSGSGAVINATSTTDSRGIASATLSVGPALGTTVVRATSVNRTGSPATFTATTINTPVIVAVTPGNVAAGDTVSITGSGFGTSAAGVSVLFDGLRARVLSATDQMLTVVVPACAGSSAGAGVRVARGAVQSDEVATATTAGPVDSLVMARGEVRVFTEAAAYACFRISSEPAGASYMLIPQNAAELYSIPMSFGLTALAVTPPVVVAQRAAEPGGADFRGSWELGLRARERAMLHASGGAIAPPASLRATATQTVPNVGDRRTFNTLDPSNQTVKITAEVRAVTTRAILYQDVTAPDVFTAADYAHFGELFDDPIYNTDTSVYGAVSDVDNNGRIIIVLTPSVNRLTPRGTGSFIGGYFYACDLLTKSRCTATNNGEIFYSMVPDPNGLFGDPHSATTVLRNVPPVLAHEFMHMINFSRRGTLDDLWLGEALAHTAEDIVGQVFLDRGDAATAADFLESNHVNARRYLAAIASTSLNANETPGTIELRGGGWLFLRYLRGLYGENTLLKNLTGSQSSGTRNVTTNTGKPWSTLVSDFAVALYADDNPDLSDVQLAPQFTFVNTNVRQMLGSGTFYPLATTTHAFTSFFASGSLPSSAWQYEYVQTPAILSNAALNLTFSGDLGGGFNAATAPQLTVLRVR